MIIEHLNGTPKVSLLLLGPKNSGKSALLKSIIEKEKSRNIPPGQKKPAIVIDEVNALTVFLVSWLESQGFEENVRDDQVLVQELGRRCG
ncbi:hypothetical protein Ndes2526B_g04675 [Nannochloris sp. 'desiccata']